MKIYKRDLVGGKRFI